MRSLTYKLIVAFLSISLISIGVIVALTHFATNREFNRFISEQYKIELSNGFASYYQEHGTWDGVDKVPIRFASEQPGPRINHRHTCHGRRKAESKGSCPFKG